MDLTHLRNIKKLIMFTFCRVRYFTVNSFSLSWGITNVKKDLFSSFGITSKRCQLYPQVKGNYSFSHIIVIIIIIILRLYTFACTYIFKKLFYCLVEHCNDTIPFARRAFFALREAYIGNKTSSKL